MKAIPIKRLPIKTFPVRSESPFTATKMQERFAKKVSEGIEVAEVSTGDIKMLSDVEPAGRILHDAATYVKMFPDGLKLVERLSGRGLSLLVWVLLNLKPHQHETEIRYSELVKWNQKMKGDAYYYALSELLTYGFLARSVTKNKFFINFNLFFNGDRRKIKQKKKVPNES